jgi:hypothetical protein
MLEAVVAALVELVEGIAGWFGIRDDRKNNQGEGDASHHD